MSRARAAVILAAGHGSRMASDIAKPLHELGGRTLLDWSLALADALGAERKVVVWGAHSPAVRDAAEAAGALAALQDPPQGTGHAVLQAREALEGFDGDVIVLYADTPLIQPATVERLLKALKQGAAAAVLGFDLDDPSHYGRLVMDEDGGLERIVEAREASKDELRIKLVNSGIMAARSDVLFSALSRVTNDNTRGEYYLTDVIGLARSDGLSCAAVNADAAEVLGVNDRSELAAAEAAFQSRARRLAMQAGATLVAPETVHFSCDTRLGRDVVVEPHVVFGLGVTVGDGARIKAFSHLEGAEVGNRAQIGPYARLRPGTKLGEGVKIGNFVETKKADIADGAKVNHLSYVGDASVGAGANIGAGVITCNYDGYTKSRTVIGEGAFIGSNCSLVAPVTIGPGAYTGSGGVITSDVPGDALAVARARQETKPGWAERFRRVMSARKAKS
ncbi:MAG: bifunctional UDP-N-acetylglucosamine diphosphorylase/glucosamine-1-phosphate N-acetyltransferase GlmU [Pseudomonadota bacterium]